MSISVSTVMKAGRAFLSGLTDPGRTPHVMRASAAQAISIVVMVRGLTFQCNKKKWCADTRNFGHIILNATHTNKAGTMNKLYYRGQPYDFTVSEIMGKRYFV